MTVSTPSAPAPLSPPPAPMNAAGTDPADDDVTAARRRLLEIGAALSRGNDRGLLAEFLRLRRVSR